jgi:uncharacterized protein YvpB
LTRSGDIRYYRSSRQQQVYLRRRLVAGLLVVLLLAGAVAAFVTKSGASDDDGSSRDGASADSIELVADGDVLATIEPDYAARVATGSAAIPIPERRREAEGGVSRTLLVRKRLLRERLAQRPPEQGEVEIPEKVITSRVETPVVQQIFQNNCETAALSMLLATVGVQQSQEELQEEIRTSGPLDPTVDSQGRRVWGDPELGFVGRAPGGGVAGGFGVFENPVLELARRWAPAENLSQESPASIYRTLRQGRAVMTWIGLSDGPYESWISPSGREVTVNFGEHTVVLTGIVGSRLLVNDPLTGERVSWSKEEFEAKWQLLDRRAIALR